MICANCIQEIRGEVVRWNKLILCAPCVSRYQSNEELQNGMKRFTMELAPILCELATSVVCSGRCKECTV